MIPHILIASGYTGKIVTLYFDPETKSLKQVAEVSESEPKPSWQLYDRLNKRVYTTNEGEDAKSGGSIDCYSITRVGELDLESQTPALFGGVSLASTVDTGLSMLFSASYDDSAIQIFSHEGDSLKLLQTLKFDLKANHSKLPNVNQDRQEAAHPHQVVVDPTGKFLLVCDLGCDLIRVFGINPDKTINEKDPLEVASGAGPRHVIFDQTGKYMYCIEELANTVQVYEMSYGDKEMKFQQIQRISTLRDSTEPKYSVDDKPKAAEGYITNDNKLFYVSNRYDAQINGEDTLVHYTISDDGKLTFKELSPAGGTNIRHFSVDEEEKYFAVASQDTGKVVIYGRDANTGKIEGKIAEAELEQVVSVNWWFRDPL